MVFINLLTDALFVVTLTTIPCPQDDMLSHLRANRKNEDVDREALMAYTMGEL